MTGNCHDRLSPALASGVRLKGLPAGLSAGGFLSADTYRQAGTERAATFTTSNDNVRDAILLRRRNTT
jgi:hypothetical protein